MPPKKTLTFEQTHGFLQNLFDGDLHAKRVLSLGTATLGVLRTGSLAVNTIGQGASNVFTEAEIDTLVALGPTLEGKTERQQNPHPIRSLARASWNIARLKSTLG